MDTGQSQVMSIFLEIARDQSKQIVPRALEIFWPQTLSIL